jgi:PKD repeat protein
VTFSGAMSYDPDGAIVSYAWSFSEGGSATGSGVSRTYTTPGTYLAYLTVTDDRGATSTDFVTITVSAPSVTVAAPSGLTAKVSGKTVTLAWSDNSTNEDGFYVERAAKPGRKQQPAWSRVATLGPNVKTFAQTVASGTWLYRVQAFRTDGVVSAYSSEVSVRVR